MYILYHHPICPFSRKIITILNRKGLAYKLILEKFWDNRDKFLQMNPMGTVPFIISKPDISIYSSNAIVDYLDETHPEVPILYGSTKDKINIKKISNFVDESFFKDCVSFIIYERVINCLSKKNDSDQTLLSIGRKNLNKYLDFFEDIINKTGSLSHEEYNLADITLSSHLSCLDYLGEIKWNMFPDLKSWYSIMKSMPDFRAILNLKINGFKPSSTYIDLDF